MNDPDAVLSLRFTMSGDAERVVDRLLDDDGFVRKECMGMNDMGVASAMITAALIIIATHCKQTGDNVDDLIANAREFFDIAAGISKAKIR